MKYANLHLHSTFSDSQLTPLQVVRIGKSLGYNALTLTDHETDGGLNDFFTACENEGLEYMAGIEFYGMEEGVNLHLTALDYDINDPGIRAFVKERCELMAECTRRCVERGIKLGFIHDFTWNDVLDVCDEGAWICIDHVIRAMKQKRVMPAADDGSVLRQNVFKGPEPKSFFPEHPTAEQVIKMIRKASGVAVLAHPYKGQTRFVERLVGYGLNGIEISHPDLQGNDAHLALQMADTFCLYRSGGTDHTGAMSGCGGVNAVPALQGITEEEFIILRERRLG
ncbi:MAG: PHP domain-containing protein [Clostridia bacterium]|nr:PHP domain-containing protein [Clostridia bacterium]